VRLPSDKSRKPGPTNRIHPLITNSFYREERAEIVAMLGGNGSRKEKGRSWRQNQMGKRKLGTDDDGDENFWE